MKGKQQFLQQAQMQQQKLSEAKNLSELKTKRLKEIYVNFKENLQKFASKYKQEINSNPEFREKFSILCNDIGIDPIVSRKTLFTDLGFGEFYNQLFMAIIDICQKRRSQNGGLMLIEDVIKVYQKSYQQKISRGDVKRALKTSSVLGSGCQIIKENYICTLPFELSEDSSELIFSSEEHGFISYSIMKKRGWEPERFQRNIDLMIKEGLVWIDKKSKINETLYFFSTNLGKFKEKINIYELYLK